MKRTNYRHIKHNIGLIKKIATSFHVTTRIELDDLISEGYLTYLETIENWNPSRGKISTYMWYCLHSNLTNYCVKEKKCVPTIPLEDMDFISKTSSPFFERLNEEAYVIAKIILNSPEEFISFSKKAVQEKLKKILYNKGWTEERINSGFVCLQSVFS